jgi:hypothetical protein
MSIGFLKKKKNVALTWGTQGLEDLELHTICSKGRHRILHIFKKEAHRIMIYEVFRYLRSIHENNWKVPAHYWQLSVHPEEGILFYQMPAEVDIVSCYVVLALARIKESFRSCTCCKDPLHYRMQGAAFTRKRK